MSSWDSVATAIANATAVAFRVERTQRVGGGCISAAWVVDGRGQRYFVKLANAAHADMFAAEAAGLEALAATRTLRIPQPIAHGTDGAQAWLVLEHIEFGAPRPASWQRMGAGLARLHRCVGPAFGWHRDNTLGATPQPNAWTRRWVDFLRTHRLGWQLALAARNGHGGQLQRDGERLLERLDRFFVDHDPQPSLLHGDLWGGNAAFDATGSPVLFDPAVYHGDREADLAMTELFGGFDPEFQAAYRSAWPPDPGYRVRRTLYNLYHVLNHLNLFGAGYLARAGQMLARLVAET